LNLAIFYNENPAVIQFLINQGADVNIPDIFNETPLHNAIKKEDLKNANLLLQHGADVRFKNDQGQTPLDLARSLKTIALLGLEEDLQ